jgi:hypothetical protein
MRDIILYTKRPIVYEDCVEAIIGSVKNAVTTEKNYFHSSGKDFWCLELENEDLETALDGFDEDYVREQKQWERNHIPFENPLSNLLQIHRSIDAKRIIAVLMKVYPELYVEVDDVKLWLGTAQEYLDTQFDY